MKLSATVFIAILICFQFATVQSAKRLKRVSDQRLAELETLVALSKMSGKLVTVPLALGKVDPKYIGRKRRSQSRLLDALFNHSSEEDGDNPPSLNYADPYTDR